MGWRRHLSCQHTGRRAHARLRRRFQGRVGLLTLIVDTGPIVALGDRADPRHLPVREVLEGEPGQLVMPSPVTAEVDYLVRRRGSREAAHRFLQDLAAGRFAAEGLTRHEYDLALGVDDQYADLGLGLADLSVIILAFRFRTVRLLTFDERHFRPVRPLQGGSFTLLPADR